MLLKLYFYALKSGKKMAVSSLIRKIFVSDYLIINNWLNC